MLVLAMFPIAILIFLVIWGVVDIDDEDDYDCFIDFKKVRTYLLIASLAAISFFLIYLDATAKDRAEITVREYKTTYVDNKYVQIQSDNIMKVKEKEYDYSDLSVIYDDKIEYWINGIHFIIKEGE